MCCRFAIIPDNMKARYKLEGELIELIPNYNAAPGQNLPLVVRIERENNLDIMRWGLVPHWSKDDKIEYKMINARSETLLEKASFKHPFKSKRCLVPISGFYEWKRLDEKHKIPYFIHLKDESILSLAGIYDYWTEPVTNQTLTTFSIITAEANKDMQSLHDRMPVIINPKNEEKYLEADVETAYSLLKPSDEKLDIYEVSRLVNSPQNNNEELLKQSSYKIICWD